jgi:protein-S-isoprenylcysteine O-methyltransferase Ste14
MAYRKGRPPWTNHIVRASLLAFALSTLLFYKDFAEHFYAHFTGSLIGIVVMGQWQVVAVNIAFFISFLVPLTFRRKANWKEYGLVVAFFVSLFVEMYGIPLTIMLASRAIGPQQIEGLHYILVVPFLGVNLAFTIPMVYGTVLMCLGMALIIFGWVTLYKNIKKAKLVTTGVYSVSRNPQYLGFMMVIVGWLVGWPTLLTIIFAPILLYFYYRLCMTEEKEVSDLPGYRKYRRRVPLLV